MKVAYEGGVNVFDNAEIYANGDSEILMERAVNRGIKEKFWSRSDLVITTKLFFGYNSSISAGGEKLNSVGLSRKHVLEGAAASLDRMGLEYVDIVSVIDTGKAFYWATSEWPVERIFEACEVAEKLNMVKPIADQCEHSLIVRDKVDRDYEPVFEKYRYGTMIWSPLASGVLTGKYLNGNVPDGSRFSMEDMHWLKQFYFSENSLSAVQKMKPIAERLGCTLEQLSLAFSYVKQNVTSIVLGATSVKQLKENLEVVEISKRLTPAIMDEIESVWNNKPKLGRTES
ncbi:hypothetical protein NDN08_001825 [Rhodosorus marinus]|uniref:NADP-dependent oxidoreductase domain-containing protein n=1 Tax=Rhodosorus marinus TaxID=101924 RepID=A0AAV8UW35_9RHOD|nr:hypothetical protein NDN08_001825 [Rhodosorus marinus]